MNKFFFALDIEPTSKNSLSNYRETIPADSLLPFRLIDKENFHLTLCFLGALNNNQQTQLLQQASLIAKSLTPIPSRQLLFDKLHLFKKPQILCLSQHQNPTWLIQLAKQLSYSAKTIAIPQENRPYHPHISLFRKAKYLPENITSPHIQVKISSFSLYKSILDADKLRYLPVKTWLLS